MLEDKEQEEIVEEVEEVVEPVLPPAPVTSPTKRITFKQFISGKNVKPHHMSGLLTYIGNPEKLRTHEQWESAIAGY